MTEVFAAVAAAAATAVIALFGPRLIGWRVKHRRKKLLKQLLTECGYPQGVRSMEVLTRQTGTSEEECYTLLSEIGGRGVKLPDGRVGWTLGDGK